MMKKYIMLLVGLSLTIYLIGLSASASDYKTLTAQDLRFMLNEKNFFLLDVHVPEQPHIQGTDAFIDYRKIRQNADKLPTDKNMKIVVYCVSGGMSRAAAKDLINMGYANVYNLRGGTRAFNKLEEE